MKKIDDSINNITNFSQTHISKIVISVICCALLWFFNLVVFSFMSEFYSSKNMKTAASIVSLFLSIVIFAFLIIMFFMTISEVRVIELLVLGAGFINVYLTFSPYVIPHMGLSAYQEFCIITLLISDVILAIWIANHISKVKSMFVTIEVKKTEKIDDKVTIEETRKNYPVFLPIFVAMVGAAGAIIAALLK